MMYPKEGLTFLAAMVARWINKSLECLEICVEHDQIIGDIKKSKKKKKEKSTIYCTKDSTEPRIGI